MKKLTLTFVLLLLTSLLYADIKESAQIQVIGFKNQEKTKRIEKKLQDLRAQKDLSGLVQILDKYRLKLDKSMSSDKLIVYKVREYSKLYTAVLDDDIEKVKEALQADKSEIDEVYHDRYTALITASYHGQDEIVKLLLDAGADVDKTVGKNHENALYHAVWEGHLSTIKLLLAAGANIEGRTGFFKDYTPLMTAARRKSAAVVAYLLQKGADAKAHDTNGYTPLMLAMLEPIKKDYEKIILLLISKSDVNQKTKPYKGRISSALSIAFRFHRSHNIIDALLDAGADAGESVMEKHALAKAFLKYSTRYKNKNKLYTYAKMVLSQIKNSKDPKIENDLVYLYSTLYELSIVTGHPLSEEELQGFSKLSQKYPKAKAYLEMFYVIESSIEVSGYKHADEWKKQYAHLIKNEWDFSVLNQWAKTLDKDIQTSVTDTLETLKDAIH